MRQSLNEVGKLLGSVAPEGESYRIAIGQHFLIIWQDFTLSVWTTIFVCYAAHRH